MKKNIILSLIGVALGGLLLSSCSGGKPESVTAVVAGPDGQPAAVVVKYAKAVSAQSVTADAYKIAGQEIETVFVTDKDITAAPAKSECDASAACDSTKHDCAQTAEKAECDTTKVCHKAEGAKECKGPESVDGEYVVIVLKNNCAAHAGKKHDCGKAAGEKHDCGKAAGEKHDCGKAAGEKHDCGKAAGEKHDCGKAAGEKHDCGKAAGEKHDCGKAADEKHDCGKAAGEKHDCGKAAGEKHCSDTTKVACDSTKAECNKAQKSELAVPAITVEQVKEIKYVDGGAVKAWGKAFSATKAVPCMKKKGHGAHHHGGETAK